MKAQELLKLSQESLNDLRNLVILTTLNHDVVEASHHFVIPHELLRRVHAGVLR